MNVVVCRACGAKIKVGRARCLRCGADLPSAAPKARPVRGPRAAAEPVGFDLRQALVWVLFGVMLVLFWRLAIRQPPATSPQGQPAVAAAAAPEGPPEVPVAVDGGPPIATERFIESTRLRELTSEVSPLEEERWRRAVQNDPSDAVAMNSLARALEQSGSLSEAVRYHQLAVARAPQVWEYRFDLGVAYSRQENWSRAASEYRTALELVPEDHATLYNLGVALERQGRDEEAIALYEQALALAPGEPAIHLGLGVSLERSGRPRDAIFAYRRFLQRSREDTPVLESVRTQLAALEAQPEPAEGAPAAVGQP